MSERKTTKGLKLGLLIATTLLNSYVFGQPTVYELEKEFDFNKIAFNVENVVKVEHYFGLEIPKGFNKAYKKFMRQIPTKEEFDELTKEQSEEEKVYEAFKIIGNSLETIRGEYKLEELLLTPLKDGKIINDCDGFCTFYASGLEKITGKVIDSTKFKIYGIKNHVFMGYEENDSTILTWETIYNKHMTIDEYCKELNISEEEFKLNDLSSKNMWGLKLGIMGYESDIIGLTFLENYLNEGIKFNEGKSKLLQESKEVVSELKRQNTN